MKRQTLISAATAAALACSLATYGTPVLAVDHPAQSAPAGQDATADQDAVKVSEDAAITMRNVHDARLAIYDGQPDQARTFVDAAVTRIEATSKEAADYARRVNADHAQQADDDTYVPFDAVYSVTDEFVFNDRLDRSSTPRRGHAHHAAKAESSDAVKLDEVDVAVSAPLVPVKFAETHIEQASKLLDDGKYYEANLALKAIEDAVVVDTQLVADQPNSGTSS